MHRTLSDPAHYNEVALNHEMKAFQWADAQECSNYPKSSSQQVTARASGLIARLCSRKRHRRMQAHPKSGMHYV